MEQLRAIHLPPEPSLWPPAPGWWLLALLAAWLAWRTLAATRRALARLTRRRAALAALAEIQARVDAEPACGLCANVSLLLRRIALGRYPPREVAALTGERWLQFLQHSSNGEAAFAQVRQALLDAPYQRGGDADVNALVSCARVWVRKVM